MKKIFSKSPSRRINLEGNYGLQVLYLYDFVEYVNSKLHGGDIVLVVCKPTLSV